MVSPTSEMVPLSEPELDALRELANIGCGNAANALSRLLGGPRVSISVPSAEFSPLNKVANRVGGESEPVAAVQLDVSGGISGQLLLVMVETSVRKLAGLLLGSIPSPGPLTAEVRSAILETGNIVGSACLSAIGTAFGLRLMPSIPKLALMPALDALAQVVGPLPGSQALVLETRFSVSGHGELSGHFLILPELPSLPRLLDAMGLTPSRG